MDATLIDAALALLTLSAMEIVLGIDNVIFIAILVARVEDAKRERLRRIGLLLALGMRIGLLMAIEWIMSLTDTVLTVMQNELSGRDLILLAGGAFLIAKSTHEIHDKVEGASRPADETPKAAAGAASVLAQIIAVDVVFSLDSVITAVGMADQVWVMVVAMVLATVVMLVSAKPIGDFVEAHPTLKVLALAFLILIGVMLVAEGLGQHVSKGYIYFAMAFSLVVEMINMRVRKRAAPVAHSEPS
ncbi:MAG: TerC family protein [Myxococcales bacterium]|nr:TerC family protein [Myxococcales bacterium]MCB9626098.1 TerC family protein [Sandaracinaceae bacterium]